MAPMLVDRLSVLMLQPPLHAPQDQRARLAMVQPHDDPQICLKRLQPNNDATHRGDDRLAFASLDEWNQGRLANLT